MHPRVRTILFIDVANSTGLLASAEDGSESKLARVMQQVRKLLAKRGGQEFFAAGDGTGYFFGSEAEAAHAACDVVERARDGSLGVAVRVGVHTGDVVKIENAYYGIAIHVAARLQARADVNTIMATASAAEKLRADEFAVTAGGDAELKGIAEPVAVARIERVPLSRAAPAAPRDHAAVRGRLAVLPFEVHTDDERWRSIANAFTEDLTGNLCRFRSMAVIAPHSSQQAARISTSSQEAGRRLDAAYLASGRILVSDGRFRVAAHLIDVESDTQIWAEKYDRTTNEVFEVLDELANRLAGRLVTQVEHSELRRIRIARVETLEAYELLLRGFESMHKMTKKDNKTARECFRKSVNLSPSFARAYAAVSKTYNLEWRYRWSPQPDRSLETALELASLAVEVDRMDPRGHAELGFAHLYRGEIDASLAAYEESLSINPNDADIIAEHGDVMTYDGRPAEAVIAIDAAIQLNPVHPDWYLWLQGGAYHQMGRYDTAIQTLKRMKNPGEAARLLASSYAHSGNLGEARQWADRVLKRHPTFKVADWASRQPFRHPKDLAHFLDGLRQAGLG